MKLLKEISARDLKDNVFKAIGDDWMLITAGTMDKYNTMTASWGMMGVLWGRDVCACFIRPVRYTYEFIEKSEYFTLSFFEKSYKNALAFCGSKSGRDYDKAKETGLTPRSLEQGVFFDEARLVLLCRKIYFDDFKPAHFMDPAIEANYPNKDYHRMYIGEIVKCYEVE